MNVPASPGFLHCLRDDERASSEARYALLAAVVVGAAFLAIWILRDRIDATFARVAR